MTTRPFRLKYPEPTESQVQGAILHVLKMHPRVARVWRTNTGAGMLTRPGGKKSQWMTFGFAGQPDLCGYMTCGKALFVEVKRPSGTLKPEQEAFLKEARRAGCIAIVARSVEDVIEALL